MNPVMPHEVLFGSAQMLFWLLTVISALAGCLWFARG
jgi:hypothetical protein